MARVSPRSYDLTSNPYRPFFPRSRTRVPGLSWLSTHGWLNQAAPIVAVPSEIRAVTIVRRPRSLREETLSTSPATTTSSSPRSSAIATSSAADS